MKKRGRYLGAGPLMIIMVFIILYGTFTPFVGKLTIVDVSSTFGRNETLTDRTGIWAFLVPYAKEKPILGHGFGGFWTDEMRSQTSSHAHNGYLDTILNMGFLGLMLFSIFLLSSCRKAHKAVAYHFDWSVLWICFLLMAVVHNIAESTVVSFTTQLMVFVLFLAVCSKTPDAHNHFKSSPI
jgi:O-antigen ligase